jgi:hypothetical protein
VADKRLDTYLVLLAPVLVRIDGVTDDPADVEIAEAILVAAESADGIGVTRSEIAARAGLDPADPRFAARFDMLARAGALQHLRGDKKHQSRYLPDPVALLAAEILARLNSDHGAEELHSLLVAAADRLEAAFREDADTPPPTVAEVAVLVTKLSVLLHAYAQRMEAATTAGTYQDLIRARTGSSTSQQMEQIERVCRAINREKSPYGRLFHDANRLLAAGQRFVAASEQLTKRLVEVVTKGEGGSVLGLASFEQYLHAAISRNVDQLAAVGATVPLEAAPPLVHLADLAQAAAELDLAPQTRTVPIPPQADPCLDPRAALAERQRRAEQRAEVRRSWAARLLADHEEVDLTSHATTWPHAAKLLADVMALSRDPTVAVAADIGDPPLIQPGAEVAVQHPLRLRRLPVEEAPAKEPGTAGFSRREAQ